MSDCSTNAFKAQGIGGHIVWQGLPASPLAFARYVNGTERVAKCIELDGERYERVRECEYVYNEEDDRYHCTNCGHRLVYKMEFNRFCHWCGAKAVGE